MEYISEIIAKTTLQIAYNKKGRLKSLCKLRKMAPSVRTKIINSSIFWRNTPSFSQIRLWLCVWRSLESSKSHDFQKMDKKEFRVLIKHYLIKGKSPQETKEKLDKHYGESAPPIRTVYK